MTTPLTQLIRRLLIGVVAVNLFILILTGVEIERSRARDYGQAVTTLHNLSRVLEHDIAGILGKIDLTLLSIRDELAGQVAEGGMDRARIEALLARSDAYLPESLGLRVIDAEGEARYVVSQAPNGKVNVADRPHFIALRDDPRAGLIISAPLLGRLSGKWIIVMGRRINGGDGAFAGQIHAAVGIEQFSRIFATIDVGPKGLIALRNGDAALIARYPEPEKVGSTIGDATVSPLFREFMKSGQALSLYTAVSPVDHIERLFINRKIDGYPLFITIGLATEDYLADWRRDSLLLAGLAGIFMIAISISAVVTIRLWRRREEQTKAAARMDAMYTAALLQSKEDADQARHHIELILGSAGEGICGIDARGRLTFINDAGQKILGLADGEGMGENLHDLVHRHHDDGSDHPAEACPLNQTLRDGLRRHVESDVYWRRDGTAVPVEFTSAPVIRDGSVIGAVNVFRDIGRRLRAEETLARNLAVTATLESVLRCSLESLPLEMILDRALDELLALPWLHLEDRGCIFLADRDRERLWMAAQRNLAVETAESCASIAIGHCLCGRVAATGETIFADRVDYRHETVFPGMADHGHYCVPIKSGGDVLGVLNTYIERGHRFDEGEERFLLMFADTLAGIIERKRIEETLRDSEEVSRTLMNATIDAAILLDRNGVILAANEALAVRFRGGVEDMVGRSFFEMLPADLAAIHRMQLDQVVRDGTPLHTHDERDGRILDNRIYPVRDALGRIIQAAVFSRDVTELRRSQAVIDKALADLADSNEELRQFAYVASHDLREPLRMVSAYLTLLQRRLGGDLSDDCREFIGFAVGGVRRMDALIHDLLEYSRIGHAAPVLAPVDLAEIVAAAVTNLDASIAECDADVDVQEGLPMVLGNPSEMIRLFQNLIGNAVKYRAPGRRPRITLGWRDEAGEWIISIRDNGIGIDPKHFNRIFMVFQRLHGRDAYEGTGIGLAICKKIIERHKGRIWIESTVGEGSVFFVALPGIA